MSLTRPVIAVGGVVIDEMGRVVLVQRAKAPLEGQWTLPGGALELEETLSEATAREVFEETGLVVEVGPLVEVYEHVSSDSGGRLAFHYVILDYFCRPAGGVLLAGSDARDVTLASEDDLDRLGVNQETRRVIGLARAVRHAEHRGEVFRPTEGPS